MAMTKAEKQRMEELEKEVRLVRALRYSTYAPPQKICASGVVPEITGYLSVGSRMNGPLDVERSVVAAWSDTVSHGEGIRIKGFSMGSRDPRALYRTKRDALIGLRLEKERDFATILADIDRAIEAEAKEEIEND
jgi:hypothetical protein